MFRKIGSCSNEEKNFSWWWLGVKVGIIAALIAWWWLDNQNKKPSQELTGEDTLDEVKSIPLPVEEASTSQVRVSEAVEKETPESVPTPSTEPDNLTKIEGIGPKINAALQEAGIWTFAKLADSTPTELKRVLTDAGIRLGYPDTWPEQAALAAKADWGALASLQSSLQGGRRVEKS